MEKCEECEENKKRYRSAFSSWICDNCKKETIDYLHPDAYMRFTIRDWFNHLSYEKKLKIYLENNQKPNIS